MDHFDELSDCSDSSRISECHSSDISTVSSLDEYKEEFLELKWQMKSSNNGCGSNKSNITSKSIVTWYETQINNLSAQLQNSQTQSKIDHNTIHNLQNKDVLNSEKVEQLLRQNQQLEDNLLSAKNQIQRLLNIYDKSKCDARTKLLEEKNLQLEKNVYELTNRNYLLLNELNQCNFQKSEVENEFKKIKSESNELKLELAAKATSVNELKKKILEQHVQLEEITQNNVKLSHSFDLISNELEYVKKSESWHKEELQQVQQEKRQLGEKILENEKFIAAREETVEQLKLELNSLKCSCDEVRLGALKEKEKLLKQLELEITRMPKNEGDCDSNCGVASDVGNITNHYESIISDLTSDVLRMKSNFEYQQKCLVNISKEKSDILGKYMLLQKSLKDNEDAIEKFESITKDLREKLSFSTIKQREQTLELLDSKEICAKLKTELSLKNQERENFEESVSAIKKQFKLFISKHTDLKNELHTKNKEISQLQYERRDLLIENDRRLFELNKNLEKSTLEIDKLEQKISYLEAAQKDMDLEKKQHLTTIENINIELVKIKTSYGNLCTQDARIFGNNNLWDKDILSIPDQELAETKFLSLYSANIEDILKKICYLCKINYDDYRDFVANTNLNENQDSTNFIQLLFNKIQTHIQLVQACKNELLLKRTNKLNTIRRNIVSKIFNLTKRCKILEISNEENMRALKLLCSKNDKNVYSGVEIQRLQTQIQVKAQEEKDKQKRYERNYRTLLRKVKEHMKGRKTTEKHNVYLQELYNTASSECNTLKLKLDLKISEVNELQKRLEKFSSLNEKLKSTVLKLEERLSITKCTNCSDVGDLKEKSLKNYEHCDSGNITELKLKEELLESLQNEKKQLLIEISSKDFKYMENISRIESVVEDNKTLSAKIIDVEAKLTQEKSINQQIRRELKIVEADYFKEHNENNLLTKKLEHVTEKESHLLAELKYLNSCLQSKSEEVIELQQRKENSGRRWLEKETNMQNLIRNLSSQIHAFKIEIDTIKNEKFFLQRLCNDLKIALKTQAGHNKTLKQFVEDVHKQREKNGNESIILSKFPSPVKYDDVHIDKLLKESKAPMEDKPFCDIQDCLNTLRMEILLLQKQITDKNLNEL